MPTGTSLTYVAGNGHRPLPMATDAAYRKAHAPQPKKPTGLDWDALTPKCKECQQKSGQLDNTDTCPTCRGVEPSRAPTTKASGYASVQQSAAELERRFTAPATPPAAAPLEAEVDDMEDSDPDVAAAAASLDQAVDQITHPADFLQAPEETPAYDEGVDAAAGPQEATPDTTSDIPANPIYPDVTSDPVAKRQPEYSDEANLDAQMQHVDRVLRDTAGSTHPVVRLLRLNAFAAVEALHLHTMLHPQTAAPATSTPTGAAPQLPRATTPGLGGDRPAAATGGEARRQPANPQPRRIMDTDEARRQRRRGPTGPRVDVDRIVALYTAGQTIKQVYEETGYATATIRRYLKDRGLLRTRGPAPGTGGKKYDQALVDAVRSHYVDDGLTQTQVAEKLGIGLKVVQNVMAYASIEARASASARSMAGIGHPIKIQPDQHQTIIDRYKAGEPAAHIGADYDATVTSIYHVLEQHGVERTLNRVAPGVDTLGRLRTAIDATGVTARDIKDWGMQQGLITSINRGLPHLGLVEAYTTAHPTTPTGDTAA